MHLRGTHTEHRTRFVSRTDSKGNPTTTTEHYTETVTGTLGFDHDLGMH